MNLNLNLKIMLKETLYSEKDMDSFNAEYFFETKQ